MKSVLYSVFFCCLLSASLQAQPAFRSIDTLLMRNFETVGLRDSMAYLFLLNLKAIIGPSKKMKSHSDSLRELKPYTDAFSEMSRELREFAGTDDIEVKYDSYTSGNTAYYDTKASGKLLLQVTLLINNTFTVKVPFFVMADKGRFTIEHPMMVMFAE